MRPVACALVLALCAQAAAAQESTAHFLPTDRVRYQLQGKPHWQEAYFQSISARGLIFADHVDAPLDTLPLATLNAVELDRGKHVEPSRMLAFTLGGFFVGGAVVGAVADQPDCGGRYCLLVVNEPALIGAGVGGVAGFVLGLIPVRQWERVHGERSRHSSPWSSHGLGVKLEF